MNRNLNRRIHPIAEADGLSPKKTRKNYTIEIHTLEELINLCEKVGDALIVSVDYLKPIDTKEYSIQIYDTYIE